MSKSHFPYSDDNKRYHTYSYFLRQKYGGKVSRISLNGGMSCPNLDGTKGTGGCSYCSPAGSGEFAGDPCQSVAQQFAQVAEQMRQKWETTRHIAYFQARSNTYAPVRHLRALYEQALNCPGVVGIAIATRPDCLPEPVCDLLAELAQKTDLLIELGLQTAFDETGERINRCHTLAEFCGGFERLRARGISVGVHLINGLPGESPAMMRESARIVAAMCPAFLKLHQLQILRGTPMADQWECGAVPMLTREEYVEIVCDQLEEMPPETVIGRLTGDGPQQLLLAPDWSKKKLCVHNEIDKEFVRRQSMQGSRWAT